MDFENLLNFERASVAIYFDADGVLQTAAINEPRLDHNPVTLEPLGLLIEEQRTNLFLHSNDVSNASWTKANSTVTAEGYLFKLADDNSLNAHTLFRNTPASAEVGEDYTLSTVCKAGSVQYCQLELTGQSITPTRAVFDLLNGVVFVEKNINNPRPTMTDLGNGLYRCSITATTDSTGSVWSYLYLHNGTTFYYQGDGTGHIYTVAQQLEKGSTPTSYIPTGTSAVTRSADYCQTTSVDPWIDQSEGTLYIEFTDIATPGRYIELGKDGQQNGDRLQLFNGVTGYAAAIIEGGVVRENYIMPKHNNKLAFSFSSSGTALSSGGQYVQGSYAGALPAVKTALSIGSGNQGANTVNATIKDVKYFPRVLTETEMKDLTT